MITFLLIIIVFQICGIGYFIERSVYTPYIRNLEFKKIMDLKTKWEAEQEENRIKADKYNKNNN